MSWISLTEIRALDGTRVEQTRLRTNDQGIANSAARILPRDTVCFSRTASVGFVTIMAAPMATSQDFANWVCSDELDPEYLMYALICSRRELRELATGATHKTIYMPTLESFHLCMPDSTEAPSIEKQRQIAARLKAQLAEVETARQAAQTQIKDTDLLRSRLLQAAFDQLTCEPTMLGQVLNGFQTGKSFQTAEVLARPDELGVLKVSAVSWTQFQADQAKALKGEYTPAESHRIKQGDLLISRANTRELVGAVVLVERDHPMRLLSDKTLRLMVNENSADKDYLLFALRTELAREHIELYATGSSDSMRNISQDVIASTPILLPSLDEQRRIAAHLKAQLAEADAITQAASAQLVEIERLPQKLLAQAFHAQGEVP